ncbi:MAG: hypothetical protein GXY43_03805 [Clostridiaceae bacterium]|nr:hypothetical protein [Clostridiaceae bacterium]
MKNKEAYENTRLFRNLTALREILSENEREDRDTYVVIGMRAIALGSILNPFDPSFDHDTFFSRR